MWQCIFVYYNNIRKACLMAFLSGNYFLNIYTCVYMKARLPSLRSNPRGAHTHMHRHAAPPEYMETITGSTLVGPPLYLPIHPRFLNRVWVMERGREDTGWSEEM